VLALSDIRMLRDFGVVTLIDLSVSLVGVLVALPATLVIADTAAEGGGRQQRVGIARGMRRAPARLLSGLRSFTVRHSRRERAASGSRWRGSERTGSGHGPV
jgi:hypothetical protein